MAPLIHMCLFTLFSADTVAADNTPVISVSPISQPRQLTRSVWIPEKSPVVFLNKTSELKAYGTPWGEMGLKASILYKWKKHFLSKNNPMPFTNSQLLTPLPCWWDLVIWLFCYLLKAPWGAMCCFPWCYSIDNEQRSKETRATGGKQKRFVPQEGSKRD